MSAQSIALAESLAKRVAEQGGAALIVDYGQDRPYSSSLQAIRQHGFVHLLSSPGHADLSCRVDFSALRCIAIFCFRLGHKLSNDCLCGQADLTPSEWCNTDQ